MKQQPYVHLVHGEAELEVGITPAGLVYERVPGWHALMAARVMPRPAAVMQNWKLGFTERDLLTDVLDRQQRYLDALHDLNEVWPSPHNLTLSLRYIADPQAGSMQAILLGKAFAENPRQSEALAAEWFEALCLLLPPDCLAEPLTSEAAYLQESGQQLLAGLRSSGQVAELRRAEAFPVRESAREVSEADYVVYPWVWHPHGLEQLWHVMAQLPAPTVYAVSLRPAYFYEEEEALLIRLYEQASARRESESILARAGGAVAADIYGAYLRTWRHKVYEMRVQVAAPTLAALPRPLLLAAGSGLSYGTMAERQVQPVPSPGYEIALPTDDLATARDNLLQLELAAWGVDQAHPGLRRFRYLVDVTGAHCGFRLPYTIKEDWPPDLRFAAE